MRKLRFNKFGLAENPEYLHCTLKWKDRALLGEIRGTNYNPTLGQTFLNVRHLNGEPWPLHPVALAVDILE